MQKPMLPLLFLVVLGFNTLIAPNATAQTETILHSLGNGADGNTPFAGLVADANGNLFGTAESGGVNTVGLVFELSPKANGTWTYRAIYNFKVNGKDGYGPWSNLIIDKAGNLYGTTEAGGVHGDGTVFELSPTSSGGWTEKVLHSFNGTDGQAIFGGLTMDAAGNLYGAAVGGGNNTGTCFGLTYQGCGVVFELRHVSGGWAEQILHLFVNDGVDGVTPVGNLAFDRHGNLYGATVFGGGHTDGVVYKLTPSLHGWSETILHSFNNDGTDGFLPSGGPIVDASGNVFGATGNGVNQNSERGSVYELSPASGTWNESILYSFQSNGIDGTSPTGSLIMDASGNLYGGALTGGALQFGAIFKLTRSTGWSESILYNFGQDSTDAEYPNGGLIFDSAGNIYGTTQAGGTASEGAIFKLTP
jgi:uncharacterized repeat protein (TIGR03803 family)